MDPLEAKGGPAPNLNVGLRNLHKVVLGDRNQRLLELSSATAGGSVVWRNRKLAEARDLLALAEIAPPGRMWVQSLDLQVDLHAIVLIRCPVPLRPDATGALVLADRAVLGIVYPEAAIQRPLPGYAFVQVLSPQGIFHPNVAVELGQPVCLGPQLPRSIRVKELVLLTYSALALQAVTIDEWDPAGVLNIEACRFWQAHLYRVPLSSTPFLCEDAKTK